MGALCIAVCLSDLDMILILPVGGAKVRHFQIIHIVALKVPSFVSVLLNKSFVSVSISQSGYAILKQMCVCMFAI